MFMRVNPASGDSVAGDSYRGIAGGEDHARGVNQAGGSARGDALSCLLPVS